MPKLCNLFFFIGLYSRKGFAGTIQLCYNIGGWLCYNRIGL